MEQGSKEQRQEVSSRAVFPRELPELPRATPLHHIYLHFAAEKQKLRRRQNKHARRQRRKPF